MTMNEYRQLFKKEHAELMKGRKREYIAGILGQTKRPLSINMKKLRKRPAKKVSESIEPFYANDGSSFNPSTLYLPSELDTWGTEYALNARGIYYRNNFSPEWVTGTRRVWVPSLEGLDWDMPDQQGRRICAQKLQLKSVRNERRLKAEYSWEADAWSKVFGQMGDDLCFEMQDYESCNWRCNILTSSCRDKLGIYVKTPETNPVTCTLTGEVSLKKRVPDLTFSLATFESSDSLQLMFAEELCQKSLTKLLVHPKCGLIADPKLSGDNHQAFPFAVYEAKGWTGNCRKARHQASTAAVSYLDMLDDLARKPGPIQSTKEYQTPTSHQYQIFCFTQFGAYWHILVAYRRPRQLDEHAGVQGMSETVYVFQRIWSGHVIEVRAAWELLTLVNQIHVWAKTEFRSFVINHLKSWHKFCEENYLLDWNSDYDCPPERKRKRECDENGDLSLPSWTNLATNARRTKIQAIASKSLENAVMKQRLLKGNGKADDEPHKENVTLICVRGDCAITRLHSLQSADEYIEHQRSFCHLSDAELDELRPAIVKLFDSEMDSKTMKKYNVFSESEFRELELPGEL